MLNISAVITSAIVVITGPFIAILIIITAVVVPFIIPTSSSLSSLGPLIVLDLLYLFSHCLERAFSF